MKASGRATGRTRCTAAAEAATLHTYTNTALDGAGANVPFVLLGDFNDEPQAATNQILLGPGGSELAYRRCSHPDKGDSWRL